MLVRTPKIFVRSVRGSGPACNLYEVVCGDFGAIWLHFAPKGLWGSIDGDDWVVAWVVGEMWARDRE